MAHDDIPEDEAPPGAIQSAEQALMAAQALFDYADLNLSQMDATDAPTEKAKKIYDAAKSLVEALGA